MEKESKKWVECENGERGRGRGVSRRRLGICGEMAAVERHGGAGEHAGIPRWRTPMAADMLALLLPIGHSLRGLEVSTPQDTGLVHNGKEEWGPPMWKPSDPSAHTAGKV